MNVFHLRSSRAGLSGILTAAFLLAMVAFAAVPAAAGQGPPG